MTVCDGVQRFHGGCVARRGQGVLILGASGTGKSDLLLRLLTRGYDLVADDRIEMENGLVRAPATLRGLVEVRGWGIVRRSFVPEVTPRLTVRLIRQGEAFSRLPEEGLTDGETGLPVLMLDGMMASAPERIDMALDCLEGRAFLLPQSAMLVRDD
ncbi:HPr kinase/phosphorylase [Acetobacter sp. UBA5411]|uniref:HPr kinase/phosphorylase n=1 Tax=Acetobacter sp. UBA5411 TaxID=1945905 RepID=UPI0025C2C7BE|nr:serine kinase [Acetobacter sp. UBA5411]